MDNIHCAIAGAAVFTTCLLVYAQNNPNLQTVAVIAWMFTFSVVVTITAAHNQVFRACAYAMWFMSLSVALYTLWRLYT